MTVRVRAGTHRGRRSTPPWPRWARRVALPRLARAPPWAACWRSATAGSGGWAGDRCGTRCSQVRYVSAEGTVVKAGGPTVKNVSGFDLCRLLVGSLGTLGLIAEVVLRTRPLPAAERWLAGEADPFALLRAAAPARRRAVGRRHHLGAARRPPRRRRGRGRGAGLAESDGPGRRPAAPPLVAAPARRCAGLPTDGGHRPVRGRGGRRAWSTPRAPHRPARWTAEVARLHRRHQAPVRPDRPAGPGPRPAGRACAGAG